MFKIIPPGARIHPETRVHFRLSLPWMRVRSLIQIFFFLSHCLVFFLLQEHLCGHFFVSREVIYCFFSLPGVVIFLFYFDLSAVFIRFFFPADDAGIRLSQLTVPYRWLFTRSTIWWCFVIFQRSFRTPRFFLLCIFITNPSLGLSFGATDVSFQLSWYYCWKNDYRKIGVLEYTLVMT